MEMLLGLGNMPSAFMHAMHWIVGMYKNLAILSLHDMPLFACCLAKHMMLVNTVLLSMRVQHLYWNKRNWVFGATKMSLLHFKVNPSGIYMEDRMVAGIHDWLVPVSTAQPWLFLRLVGYYKRFVHRFVLWATQSSTVAANERTFRWLQTHQAHFDKFWEGCGGCSGDGTMQDWVRLYSVYRCCRCGDWRCSWSNATLGTGGLRGVLATGFVTSIITWLRDRLRSVTLQVVGNPLQFNPLGNIP